MPTVRQYRSDLAELVRLANVDLEALWRQVSDGLVAKGLLAEILPELVNVYGLAAGALAADWYDKARESAKVTGSFRAQVAQLPGVSRTDALAGWAVDPLFGAEPDLPAATVRAEGGLQRIIANSGRDTITGSSIADPGADGWQRTGNGECGFCAILISRGAVYSKATADFGAHDNCECGAVPAFGGQPRPVKAYEPSLKQATQADRDRTRKWMAENGYGDKALEPAGT